MLVAGLLTHPTAISTATLLSSQVNVKCWNQHLENREGVILSFDTFWIDSNTQ